MVCTKTLLIVTCQKSGASYDQAGSVVFDQLVRGTDGVG